MKRTAPLLTLISLVLLLAACQPPPPTYTFEGITSSGGVEQPLTLAYEQRGDRLTGEYRVRAAKGVFRGTLSGTRVTADLMPSADCAYAFEGTLTDTSLSGEFQPTGCDGGESGTWDLKRR